MSPPRTQQNGGAVIPAVPSPSRHQDAGSSEGSAAEVIRRIPEVAGFALPPAGRRTRWAVLVPTCCFCRGAHLHRGNGPWGGLRVASCGRAYKVRVAGSKRARTA